MDADIEMKPVEEEEKTIQTIHTPAAASDPSISKKGVGLDKMPWVEKYRPSALDELISHQDIIHTLEKLIDSNQLPHLLFYGPPGTGLYQICSHILHSSSRLRD